MKILVLGCKGQLGRCLKDQLVNKRHSVVYSSREELDIADFEVTKNKILNIAPDVVINATAYTAVDRAEQDLQAADLINHLAVSNIASICNLLDCWLIHVSTDYVFDGNSELPYKEDNLTNPQSVYGVSKLKGEVAIEMSGCKYLIIRTAWVYSEYGNNFLKTMLRLGAVHDELSIVRDQVGCPTYAQDVAKTIVEILSQLKTEEKSSGVYHYCGDYSCSWYEFANAIFNEAKLLNFSTPNIIQSIKTSAYPTLAARPKYSVLNCSKIKHDYGINPSNWELGLRKALKKMCFLS